MRWITMVAVTMWVGVAGAQDTRVVTEPKVPPVCATLEAQLATPSKDGALAAGDEGKLDTERIQRAIDSCDAGKAVELASSSKAAEGAATRYNAFLTGPLDLRRGVTLVVGKGVTLFASRDPKVFDMAQGGEAKLCGTAVPRPKDVSLYSLSGGGKPKGGCRALININVASHAGVVGEGAGDERGTIDGRGYATLLGHDYSWWEMARRAQPKDDFYFSVRLIVATHADGLVLYGIRLVNSPNFHVTVAQTNGFTAWGVHLQTPVDKHFDARNTDGIDPGTSTNITVAHSWIDNGDDNIAVKQGVTHMSVIDNHFYSGHGMSIGSETLKGQSQLVVDGLTLDHTTTGIRIKSNVVRGGPVEDAVYRNICMRNVAVPISISPYYANHSSEPFEDPKLEGDNIPDYKGIRLENVFAETPGDVLIAGLDDKHRTEITLENVHVNGIAAGQKHMAFTDVHYQACAAHNNLPQTNILPEGRWPKSVKLVGAEVAGCGAYPVKVPDPCAGKFVPMQ